MATSLSWCVCVWGLAYQRTILGSQFPPSWHVGIKFQIKLRLQVFLSEPSPASLRTGTKETAPPGTSCVAVELPKSILANTHGHWLLFSEAAKQARQRLDSTQPGLSAP